MKLKHFRNLFLVIIYVISLLYLISFSFLGWIILIISALLVFNYTNDKGELNKLYRSIFIADKTTGFIKKIEEQERKQKNSPFDKGIDLWDVYNTLSSASSKGRIDIQDELKETGQIEQL